MEWLQDLLKLLFGHLGPLGTVCVAAAVYAAWLHHQEKEDHKETRKAVAEDAARRIEIHNRYLEILSEMRVVLDHLGERDRADR